MSNTLNVEIEAVANCNTNKWEPEITGVSVTYQWFTKTLNEIGLTEATTTIMNEGNYCQMIADLSQPTNPSQAGAITYYVESAIYEHEMKHRSDLEGVYNSKLSSLINDLKNALSIPISAAQNMTEAANTMRSNSAFQWTITNWHNGVVSTFIGLRESGAQGVEMQVLNNRISALNYAALNEQWYQSNMCC